MDSNLEVTRGGSGDSIPAPILQYWHAERPPAPIEELLASFRDLNPDMRHLVFNQKTAAALIEEYFGPRELAAFLACAVPAMQADYFRYCAVYALGGVYSDADARCGSKLSPLARREGGTLFVKSREIVINAFFAFPPRHPLLRLAVKIATANVEGRFSESVWATTGPLIFSALAALRRLGSGDAFIELARQRAGELVGRDGRAMWEPERFCELAGGHASVAAAFDGVRLAPFEELGRWIAHGLHLPYKQTDDHFTKFRSSIYR